MPLYAYTVWRVFVAFNTIPHGIRHLVLLLPCPSRLAGGHSLPSPRPTNDWKYQMKISTKSSLFPPNSQLSCVMSCRHLSIACRVSLFHFLPSSSSVFLSPYPSLLLPFNPQFSLSLSPLFFHFFSSPLLCFFVPFSLPFSVFFFHVLSPPPLPCSLSFPLFLGERSSSINIVLLLSSFHN